MTETTDTTLDGATEHGEPFAFPADAGEFAARWNNYSPGARELRLRKLATDAEVAADCYMANHRGRLEHTEAPASTLLATLHAVIKLHRPTTRYSPAGEGEFSWPTLEAMHEDGYDDGEYTTFDICAECGRIEAEMADRSGGEEWAYLESLWPCATARALGITKEADRA